MRRLPVILAVTAVATAGIVASAAVGPAVDHVTLNPGESLEQVAVRLCPQNPGAQLADLQSSNSGGGGSVLHFHPDACTGQATTTQAVTTSIDDTTTPPTVATTTPPTTSTSSSTIPVPETSTSTTLPESSTSSSVATSTTSLPPPTTSTTSMTAPPTSSTSPPTSSTTTTLPQPPGTQAFVAGFATQTDFTERFWTYTGNYCSFGFTCNSCAQGVGVCQYPGDHDMACGAPTTSRTVRPDNRSENFWWCAPGGADTGHVMAGMNSSGYSISGFAPRQAFTNIRSICWDQNLTDLGGGKWMVLTLVPANTMISQTAQPTSPYRLDYTLPEFDADNAPGDFNIQRAQRWQFKLFRNNLNIFNSMGSSSVGVWSTGAGFIAGADVATRYRHCLTENAAGQIVVTQRGVSWNTTARFPDGLMYVIWADDTYDADKHGGTGSYTWHFDNIEVLYG
jgi:hypothetical protein